MTIAASGEAEAGAPSTKAAERRALSVACGAHALHDGYTDLIYVVLPLLQAEFGLPYAALGLLRTIYSGTMSILQIPAAMVAERIGGKVVLTIGTALSGLCFCLAGASAGFAVLVVALLLGGIGASTQHPLASTLVARAFTGPRSLQALGTYNFAGDIGKMVIPAAATTMLLVTSWRSALAVLGAVGLLVAVAIYLLIPRFAPEPAPPGAVQTDGMKGNLRPGYWTLLAIGALDSMTRAGFLVFLPFLMIEKGATVTTGGFALTLVFVGGAAGKLLCARLTSLGIVGTLNLTKTLTAAGMIGVMFLPVGVDLALLPFFGVILNGPTSLTYGSVPLFIKPAGRSRGFSVFYTGTLGSAAIAPTLSGVLGDVIGIHGTIMVMAAFAMLTLPLAWQLRPALATIESAP